MLTSAIPPVVQSTVVLIFISKSVGGEATRTSCTNREQPFASTTFIWYKPKSTTSKLTEVVPAALSSEFEYPFEPVTK